MVRRSPRLNKRLYETANILLSLSNQNEEDSVSMTIIEKKTARKNVKFIENMNEDDDPSSDYSPEDEASDREASDNEEDDDPSSDYEEEDEIIEALKTDAEQKIKLCNYAAAHSINGDKARYNKIQTIYEGILDNLLKIKNKKQARAKTSGNCNHILPLVLAATITGAIAVSVPFY